MLFSDSRSSSSWGILSSLILILSIEPRSTWSYISSSNKSDLSGSTWDSIWMDSFKSLIWFWILPVRFMGFWDASEIMSEGGSREELRSSWNASSIEWSRSSFWIYFCGGWMSCIGFWGSILIWEPCLLSTNLVKAFGSSRSIYFWIMASSS